MAPEPPSALRYAVRQRPGLVQVGAASREDAIRRARSFAERHAVDVWLNLDDASLTENTPAAYPVSHIPNATREGAGGHPSQIIMLTADAFGVLPPIARLTPAQAMYHFLSG